MTKVFYSAGLGCAAILPVLMLAGASEPLVGFICLLGAALMVRSID